ncbi:hypothetical protein BGZ81_002140 [Podila clonocystis]|nr:hypothetical protein BGZ81_002140 [Podila clonocystis]
MYKDVVEEYRRVICGSRASEERTRELERTMDMIKNPHRYIDAKETVEEPSQEHAENSKASEMELNDSMSQDGDEEEYEDEDDDDEEDEFEEAEEDEHEMVDDQDELLNEIEAKGGLRRRDSGHGQSSSEMDIDDDDDEEEDTVSRKVDEEMLEDILQMPFGERARPTKREPESMSMDYQLESASRYRRGLRSRKMERSLSSEQERLIMDMALDKPYHAMGSLSPFHPLDSVPSTSSSSAPSSSSSVRSDSPAPMPTRTERKEGEMVHRTKSRTLREPRLSRVHQSSSTESPSPSEAPTLSSSSAPETMPSEQTLPATTDSTIPPASTKGDELGFDLASACANTFASDLAFVLARVPGLGAHFHRFEQLAKLKLHVGWAKHAQSRGGNDVFVMSCSRLIGLLAPLANTPLVSERGG